MNDTQIHIMCAADRAFLRHIPTMLTSIREHTAAPLHVSIVSVDWRASDQEKLCNVLADLDLDLVFLTLPKEALEGLAYKTVLSPLSYARCFMADMVKSDRFIYLDVDMIVRADINALWNIDLGTTPAAAVFHGKALNAGLLIINAQAWRARGLGATLIEWAKQHQPKEADQEAIANVLGAEIQQLGTDWNRLVDPIWGKHMLQDPAYREHAKLLHFITGFKPWNLGRFFLPKAYVTEWDRHTRPSKLSVMWRYEAKTLMWQLYILLRRVLKR